MSETEAGRPGEGNAEAAEQAIQWWYAVGGKSYGPVAIERLAELARAGHFRATDQVYGSHFGSWVRADSVHGLFDMAGTGTADSATVEAAPEGTPAYEVVYVPPAGFWRRAVALVIDTATLFAGWCAMASVVGLGTYAMLGPALTAAGPAGGAGMRKGIIVIYLVQNGMMPVMAWLYFSFMESSPWQATLGKRAVGVVVTDTEGRRIGFWRASTRFGMSILSALTLGIGYIIGAFTSRKQTLHDLIVRTVVIEGRGTDRQAE